MTTHAEIVAELCRHKSGVLPLRALMMVEPGYMRRVSNAHEFTVSRADRFAALGLADLLITRSKNRSRTWRYLQPTERTAVYAALCHDASRLSNLSWLEPEYGCFIGRAALAWKTEWLERRDAFRRALLALEPKVMPPETNLFKKAKAG